MDSANKKIIPEDQIVRLKNVNRQLIYFTALLSHDIKEPANTILFFSKLLASSENVKMGVQEKAFFNAIVESSKSLVKLVDMVRKYGNNILLLLEDFSHVDLNRSIHLALGNLTHSITKKEARIYHGQLPTVIGQEQLIIQLFQNLIENSLKHARPNVAPEVVITHSETPENYIISVKDNGKGFDPNIKTDEFSPLFDFRMRKNKTLKEGSGIGLGLCKVIMELHSGSITVEETTGEGSIISLSFPRKNHGFPNAAMTKTGLSQEWSSN